MSQLSIFAAGSLCEYGAGTKDEGLLCDRPRTHAAVWQQDAKTGRVECCLDHANYYATAWCPHYPGERTTVWMERLDAEQHQPVPSHVSEQTTDATPAHG